MRFAHNSERQFAKLLDFYAIAWEYEPRTFVLERDHEGNPAQAFTPDFYLPTYDLYIEITTLNQKFVTKKNRKARRLVELYPDVAIKVLYQRDYLQLLVKYGLEPPSQLADAPGNAQPLDLFPEPRRTRGAGPAAETVRERTRARTATLSARHRAPGARCAHGAVRWLGDADPVHRRAGGTPRVPRARGGVRRVAPRLGTRPGCGRVRRAAVGVHQRPRPHRPRTCAVHAPARSPRRPRRRRHHRVVGRADRVPGDAERIEHATIARRPRGGRRVPRGCSVRDRRRHRDARGPRGAGTGSPGIVGDDRARARGRTAVRGRGARVRRRAGLDRGNGLHR